MTISCEYVKAMYVGLVKLYEKSEMSFLLPGTGNPRIVVRCIGKAVNQ